jgi:hypothetical protein
MKSAISLTLIAWLMTSVVPITAHAQTQATPLVEGSVVLESDASPHGTSSVTSGGGGEVGIPLGVRYSIRFGAEITGWHRYEDLAGIWHQRTNAYSFLIGRRLYRTRSVQVEALAGISAMTSSERALARNPGWEWVPEKTDRWLAPTIGLGVPISVTRRLSVVPEFRWHLGLLGVIVDPYGEAHDLYRLRLGLRWQG